ncbi:BTAD domain-containing putative transcriptional regulator [Skermania piniformis]|uniref:Winged helix-turn-helix domain-containing protein n=1 Tax=Skermania pinensis TaxID=39122 RepID=A0ABX8SDB4_9ACTN|nr:BTAD domain-containing putative transcriptional regulator [Skermania piniformis]QXQ14430.1 winged helix-turn-helix domain-containing protein [Skermania piniformis]
MSSGDTGSGADLSDPVPVVVGLLGEIAVCRDGQLAALSGGRARVLLTALAIDPGRSHSAAALIDELWGDRPPRAPANALQTHVSRLRALLPDGAIEMGPAGYRLALRRDQVDLAAAQDRLRRAATAEPAVQLRIARQVRALRRGESGADLPAGPLAAELAATANRLWAELDLLEVEAGLAAGDPSGALAPARAATVAAPLDEPAHARLMSVLLALGRPNEALAVFAGIRFRLAEELGADPGPELVELNTAALQGSGPAAPTHRAIGLRAAPNVLLGRDADLAAVDAALRSSRVVTVLGPGGTGKTRVANEIGIRRAVGCRVVLVELAPVRDGSGVLTGIGATLGLGEIDRQPGALGRGRVRGLGDRLRESLAAQPALLILDNCEQVIEAVADIVGDLIATCPDLAVLTTSRSPLAIAAEVVYPLPPLAIHDDGGPAAELFRQRAQAVRPSVRLDSAQVAGLCRTLDGLPLAIELAAARVRTMSVTEIGARLDQRFAFLRGGDRTAPERHRTLQAVIDWSWNLLVPAEQAALRRLCRFPAGFTLAAAQRVAGGPDIPDVPAALDGLVGQSLLSVDEDDTGVVRYHMLETVREYGEVQLAAAAEADAVERGTALWAIDFVDKARAGFGSPAQVAAVLAVAAEQDNLVAILRRGLDTGDAGTVYSVFPALGILWVARGAHSEVAAVAPRVLALDPRPAGTRISADLLTTSYLLAAGHLLFAGQVRPLALVRSRIRPLLHSRTDWTGSVRLHAELLCGRLNVRTAGRRLAEAVRSADPEVAASALQTRAQISENLGDIHGSRRDAERALPLLEPGNAFGRSAILQHLGSLCGQSGRHEEAVTHYRAAIGELQRLQAWDEADQLRAYLAAALVGAGRLDEARAELGSVRRVPSGPPPDAPEGFGGDQRSASLLVAQGEIERAEGRPEAALATFRSAVVAGGAPTEPLGLLLLSDVIGAHVLEGRPREIDDLVPQLVSGARVQYGTFRDTPQLGSVAIAVGSYGVAIGREVRDSLDLLAAGLAAHPRQDYLSLRSTDHLDAARQTVGAAMVDAALARWTGRTRRRAGDVILDLLGRR